MAQFDVYTNPRTETSDTVPYLVDLQSDLLDTMATRVVAPLRIADPDVPTVSTLMPRFQIEGFELAMSTPELAGVSRSELGHRVGSLAPRRDEIIRALDLLFTGI